MASNSVSYSTGTSYLYVDSSPASASTSDSSWVTWRAPKTDMYYYDGSSGSLTVESGDWHSISPDLHTEGDIHAPKFEERFREAIMKEVHSYVQGMIPVIISMATEKWISILG